MHTLCIVDRYGRFILDSLHQSSFLGFWTQPMIIGGSAIIMDGIKSSSDKEELQSVADKEDRSTICPLPAGKKAAAARAAFITLSKRPTSTRTTITKKKRSRPSPSVAPS
jgi:hypothetical protein